MAGGYGNLVTCVNRTTTVLEGTFDGQIIKFEPGYVKVGEEVVRATDGHGAPVVVLLPAHVAVLVKSQNPLMGSQDPTDARPEEYLIGIEKWPAGTKDDTSHLEQSDAEELLDRSALPSDRQSAEKVRNRHVSKSRSKVAQKTRTGVKADYED